MIMITMINRGIFLVGTQTAIRTPQRLKLLSLYIINNVWPYTHIKPQLKKERDINAVTNV